MRRRKQVWGKAPRVVEAPVREADGQRVQPGVCASMLWEQSWETPHSWREAQRSQVLLALRRGEMRERLREGEKEPTDQIWGQSLNEECQKSIAMRLSHDDFIGHRQTRN